MAINSFSWLLNATEGWVSPVVQQEAYLFVASFSTLLCAQVIVALIFSQTVSLGKAGYCQHRHLLWSLEQCFAQVVGIKDFEK